MPTRARPILQALQTLGGEATSALAHGAARIPNCWAMVAMLLGSAARECREGDRYIGWSAEALLRNLTLTTSNQRFLLLP